MSLNRVTLNGRLPHFEGTYKAGEGDNGRSYLGWAISVKRDWKGPDEQYYPEDLINFKAFGPKADFINKNFGMGDGLIIEGKLQRDADYEKDGQTIKGGLSVIVESVYFAEARKAGEGDSSSKPAAKPASKPAAPKKPGVPGGAPKIPGLPKAPGNKPF